MKYLFGFDEFVMIGAVDESAIEKEAKFIGDAGLPKVVGIPRSQAISQLVLVSPVVVEIPAGAMRGGIPMSNLVRHLVMAAWEAKNLAAHLLNAAAAAEAGNRYDSEAPVPCRCDIRKVAAGQHDPGCSKR